MCICEAAYLAHLMIHQSKGDKADKLLLEYFDDVMDDAEDPQLAKLKKLR